MGFRPSGYTKIPTALPPNGAAGGDLAGTYPNPTIATFHSGTGTLDGSGSLDISGTYVSGNVTCSWNNSSGVGALSIQGAPKRVVSSGGAADAGLQVNWIAF